MRKEFITILQEKYSAFCDNKLIEFQSIVGNLEDLILPNLLRDYYRSSYKSFLRFVSDTFDINGDNLHVNIQDIYRNYIKEVERSAQLIKTETKNQKFYFIGDFHKAEGNRYRIGDKIYFSKRPYYSEILNKIISKYFISDLPSFPRHTIENNFIIREYIPLDNNLTLNEINNFYYKFGKLSSLIFFLRGIDINAENILVNKMNPVFFDLECLFTPLNNDEYSFQSTGIIKITQDYDLSAFSGGRTEMKSYLKPVLSGTEDKPVIKWNVPSKGKYYNIPIYKGEKIDPVDYLQTFVDGLKEGSKIIESNHDEIKQLIKDTEIGTRIVFTPTRRYRVILQSYAFPQIYESVSARDYFQKEIQANYNIPIVKSKEHINQDEINQLSSWIIPKFYSDIIKPYILDNNGRIVGQLYKSQLKTWLDWEKVAIHKLQEVITKIKFNY